MCVGKKAKVLSFPPSYRYIFYTKDKDKKQLEIDVLAESQPFDTQSTNELSGQPSVLFEINKVSPGQLF